MKRIATIQDISCLGKCSLTVALPVISATGVEAAILPTAVLSTHTMFKNFTCKDLSDQLLPIANHWESENISFDAIYTGYLGTEELIENTIAFIRKFKTAENTVFIDPAMADNGKLYPAFDIKYAKKMATLCGIADITVPNITEACFMTGIEYKEKYDESYIASLLDALLSLGCRKAVITGVSLTEDTSGVMGKDNAGNTFKYIHKKLSKSYHGTGDLFASCAVGALMNGYSLEKAFELAANYTYLTIKETMENDKELWYGVDFEKTIPFLCDALKTGGTLI